MTSWVMKIDNANIFSISQVDDDTIRNGRTTETQGHSRIRYRNENQSQANARKNNVVRSDRVLHETWDGYDKCYNRERNRGMFTLTLFI